MGERETPIAAVRERLAGLLADWGAELSAVLKELEDKRAAADIAEHAAAERGRELEALRAEHGTHAAETARLKSELDSKQELLRALRRDAESADRAKGELKLKDRELEALKSRALKAEQRVMDLEREVAARFEAADTRTNDASELESLRAELDARKALIKSLRADQERSAALAADLDEKREVIRQLEGTIGRHSDTIAELKRSVDVWKGKYRSLHEGAVVASGATTVTSAQVPTFTEADLRAIEQAERAVGGQSDATIAIDMRRSLLEARRAASSRASGEK